MIQTLRILDLAYNEIGDNGAHHLRRGLQKNTVRDEQRCFFFNFHYIFLENFT